MLGASKIKTLISGLILSLGVAENATAYDVFMGEVTWMAATYCPKGTLEAAGQTLKIAEYTALAHLLGTQFGGDGKTTFALPDLRGRAPVGVGQPTSDRNYPMGAVFGGVGCPTSLSVEGVNVGTPPATCGPEYQDFLVLRPCIRVIGNFPPKN